MITKTAFVSRFTSICQELSGKEVNEVRQSRDSRVFLGFGEDYTEIWPKGYVYKRRGRAIWIDSTSWRLTCNGNYIVGSGDENDAIHGSILKMMGRRFLSMKVASHLMDLQFQFDEGYVINSFSDVFDSTPWTLFYFNENLSFDTDTEEKRKEVYALAKAFDIPNIFMPLRTDVDGLTIKKVELLDTGRVIFHIRRDLALILDMWVWRLLKNGEWITGCSVGWWDQEKDCFVSDDEQIKRCLNELEGKVIKRVEVANNMLDARFYIGDEYVLETFVCCKGEMKRWGIYPGVPDPSFYAPPDGVFLS